MFRDELEAHHETYYDNISKAKMVIKNKKIGT